jgi:hypothetical protein
MKNLSMHQGWAFGEFSRSTKWAWATPRNWTRGTATHLQTPPPNRLPPIHPRPRGTGAPRLNLSNSDSCVPRQLGTGAPRLNLSNSDSCVPRQRRTGATSELSSSGSCVPRGRGWPRAVRGRGWTVQTLWIVWTVWAASTKCTGRTAAGPRSGRAAHGCVDGRRFLICCKRTGRCGAMREAQKGKKP